MPDSVASARIRNVQRTALALLIVSGAINYVDRATLAVGLPLIRQDLGLSLTQSGFLLSAFLWTYAFAQLPAGALVDRLGARVMLSVGLSLWSMAQVLGGLVGGFGQFVVARVLLGVGESTQAPSCARVVADWFHPRERGSASGLWNCGSSLGTAVAVPLLTFLMLHFGWRWMFALMGLAGIAVALVIFGLHRDPGQKALTAAEQHHLAGGRPELARPTGRVWRGLFRHRTMWGMIAGYAGAMYVLWIYTAWLPQYLEIELHLSVARTGWVAAIPFLFGVAGSLVGGWVCDQLLRRGHTPLASRKIPIVVSLFGIAICTLLAALTASVAVALAGISASIFLLYVTATSAWAMATVVAPTHCTASIGSIQNFFGYLGAALAPIVTGLIVSKTGSFHAAFAVGAAAVAAGAIAHLVLVRRPLELRAPAE